MRLSNRLEMVVSFVKPGESAADVGTDHGHVPVELVRRGIVKHAYAMDVRKGPLSRAEENIAAAGMKEIIETRLSDGVQKLSEGEAASVIIAGMGGELVIHIMENGRHIWNTVEQWVLSPQSDIHKVREWLERNGFRIVKEDMVFEEGKFYIALDVRKQEDPGKEKQPEETKCVAESSLEQSKTEKEKRYRYGTYLRENRNAVFIDFLKDEEEKLLSLKEILKKQAVDSERAKESLKEVEEKLSLNREVQNEM